MQCSAVQCSAVQFCSVPCSAAQCRYICEKWAISPRPIGHIWRSIVCHFMASLPSMAGTAGSNALFSFTSRFPNIAITNHDYGVYPAIKKDMSRGVPRLIPGVARRSCCPISTKILKLKMRFSFRTYPDIKTFFSREYTGLTRKL